MRDGVSSTRGHYSRHCHTCCVSDTVVIRHTAQSTSGWPWSACWSVQPAMLWSLVTQLPSFSPSTRPNDFTERRFAMRYLFICHGIDLHKSSGPGGLPNWFLRDLAPLLSQTLAACARVTYHQWLKCKITGGGTLHSGLGPWQWSYAFH